MRPRSISAASARAVGESAANAIPINAVVSFDFRLVPDQSPPRARGRRAIPAVSRLDLDCGRTRSRHASRASTLDPPAMGRRVPAFRADLSAPAAGPPSLPRAKRADRCSSCHDGGSVPLYEIAEILHVPVIGLPSSIMTTASTRQRKPAAAKSLGRHQNLRRIFRRTQLVNRHGHAQPPR